MKYSQHSNAKNSQHHGSSSPLESKYAAEGKNKSLDSSSHHLLFRVTYQVLVIFNVYLLLCWVSDEANESY